MTPPTTLLLPPIAGGAARLDPDLPKFAHLQALQGDELPHLTERRQAVYDAMKCNIDAIEYARLWDMAMWLTEQIVYLKSKKK